MTDKAKPRILSTVTEREATERVSEAMRLLNILYAEWFQGRKDDFSGTYYELMEHLRRLRDDTAPVSVYDMTDAELDAYVGSPDFLKAALEKDVAGLKALFEAEVQALADHREVEAGLARVELERTREQLIAFLLNFHDKITFTDGVHAR